MSKRKLLLADDSLTIQKVVNLTFANEGIEVVTVGDGDTAMKKFVEITPDLVMVDVNMPGLDGYRICEIIKQDSETKHIPVILLVGSFEPFDEVQARRVGADDFLTKPFQSIRQLVNKVSDLLSDKTADENFFAPIENIPTADSHFEQSSETSVVELPNATELSNVFETTRLTSLNFDESGADDQMIQTSHFTKSAEAKSENRAAKQFESQPVSESESFYESFTEDAESSTLEPYYNSSELVVKPEIKTNLTQTQIFPAKDSVGRTAKLTDENESFAGTRKTASAANFNDSDLLDFPQLNKKAVADQIVLPNGSNIFDKKTFESEIEAVRILPPTIGNLENTQQTKSLSPELIDAIADKVVEKISGEVIEKVVREVLAQMKTR